MNGCAMNTVATDSLVLKHQAISIHRVNQIIIILIEFHTKKMQETKIIFGNEQHKN